MIIDSFPVDVGIMHVTCSVQYILGWLIVISRSSWSELSVVTRIVSVVIAVPAVSALIPLIVVFLVSCGYLAVRAIVIVAARSAPLIIVLVGPVIFGWSCSFIVIRVFSVCKFGGNVHEFWYCFWLDVTHLLNKIWMAEPDCECIGCSFVRDILY
jgi:hypothetical protein